MHLILTGASGLVGTAVLNHILHLPATSQLTKLTILSRKPVPLASAPPESPNLQIEQITHADFSAYPDTLITQLKGAHGIIWALGVSQTEVSKEDYVKITKDYAIAAAEAFSTLSESPTTSASASPPIKPFNFIYVSGEGATHNPGRFTPLFGRVKGETELALLALSHDPAHQNLRVVCARPGGVDPRHDDPRVGQAVSEKRSGSRASGWMGKVLFPTLGALAPGQLSPTRDLGRALTELAMGNGRKLEGRGVVEGKSGEGRVVGNLGLRHLAGL